MGPPCSGKKSISSLLAKKTGSVLLNKNNLIETLPNSLKIEFSKELSNRVNNQIKKNYKLYIHFIFI